MELDDVDHDAIEELWHSGDFLLAESPRLSQLGPRRAAAQSEGIFAALPVSHFSAAAPGNPGVILAPCPITPPAASRSFRCLDHTHSASCITCSPPPPPEEVSRWELRGDPGKRNGEKLLRSLVTRTAEWNSSEERQRAANALELSDARTAAALRTRSCPDLTKACMLRLLDFWGYRSNLWVPRGNRRVVVVSPAPLRLNVCSTLPVQLDPLLNEFARLLSGAESRRLAERSAAARIYYAREVPALEGNVTRMKTSWGPFLRKLLTSVRANGTPSAVDIEQSRVTFRKAIGVYSQLLPAYQKSLVDCGSDPAGVVWLTEIVTIKKVMLNFFQLIASAYDAVAGDEKQEARLTTAVVQFYSQFVDVHITGYSMRTEWVKELCCQEGADVPAAGQVTVDLSTCARDIDPYA